MLFSRLPPVAACTDRKRARPGGVKFEPSSFKLNHEMVVLMGGRHSQGYALFQQLCVAAFLALRPHAPQLIATVQLMLGTGLPSFKGDGTIRRLRERFALGIGERQAADFMIAVVKNAHENVRSTVYDEFQRVSSHLGARTSRVSTDNRWDTCVTAAKRCVFLSCNTL